MGTRRGPHRRPSPFGPLRLQPSPPQTVQYNAVPFAGDEESRRKLLRARPGTAEQADFTRLPHGGHNRYPLPIPGAEMRGPIPSPMPTFNIL